MSASPPATLTVDELDRILRATEPAALLVEPRILRRVIRSDQRLPRLGLRMPYRACYVAERAQLLGLAIPAELGVAEADLRPQVILLRRPDPAALGDAVPGDVLLRFWRLLFYCRIRLILQQCFQDGKLDDAAVSDRLRRIGTIAVEEIRNVLAQERLLLPLADDRAVYEEFAAAYLALRHFARPLLKCYFPSIADDGPIDRLLAADIDADRLLAETRLPGAAEPEFQRVAAALELEVATEDDAEAPPETACTVSSRGAFQRLMARADWEAGRGNHVRAAILRDRAAQAAPPGYAGQARSGARNDLSRLGSRLQRALELSTAEAKPLRALLPVLLAPAAQGIWSQAARLLYDLQKVCLDRERAVFQVDLLGWVLSLGRKPLKRPLPGQETIRALRHLRSALRRLPTVAIANAERRRLANVLHKAGTRTEERIREHFRPLLQQTFADVGLRPENLPEEVARHKVIEELLDQAAERGFLTIGDLRDALSRNQLKLPDLAGPVEFLVGDPLLRTNRGLAQRLPGTYHGGEIYMRWLQRLGSVLFGTPVGRFLTRFLVLPFGSAFIILAGAEALDHEARKLVGSHAAPPPPPAPVSDVPDISFAVTEGDLHPAPVHLPLLNWYSFSLLGLFLLLVLHVPAFRHWLGQALWTVGRGLRWALIDLPAAAIRLPVVRGFLESRPWQACKQFLLKPALLAAPGAALCALLDVGLDATMLAALAFYGIALTVLNTRLGRDLEEAATDWAANIWDHIRSDFLPGLFRWIVAVFKQMMVGTERALYTVDEWLRFRSGESRLSLAVKAVLGVGWAAVTYVFRVFINLFVEPTFNPIKHFPVVTVAAKLIVPIIPPLIKTVAPVVGTTVAGLLAFMMISFLPGLAGFLVWEFKENWRLYRANRRDRLQPVVVGHHGETILRLLRPGFHSGTVPKTYARLRKAARTGERTGAWKAFARQRETLHHVTDAVRRFVDREFCQPLAMSRQGTVQVGAVELGTNCISIQISMSDASPPALRLVIAEHADCLVARIAAPGWTAGLSAGQRSAVGAALAGLYRMSDVAVVVAADAGESRPWPAAVLDGRFDQLTITWQQWVESWALLAQGTETPSPWTEEVGLPAAGSLAAASCSGKRAAANTRL